MYYLFSQSPGSGGENAYKLAGSPARLLTPAAVCSGADSPLRSLSFRLFFSPYLLLTFFGVFFLFVLLLLFFFPTCLPSRGAGMVHQHHWGLNTAVDALYLPPPSLVYFLLSVVFLLFFGEQRPLFFLLKPKVRRIKFTVWILSVFYYYYHR